MRKLILAAIGVVAFLAVQVHADILGKREASFRVKYSDGSTEQYKVRWTAIQHNETREEGEPAVPLELKLFDTRRCFWSSAGAVLRQVFFVNKNGKEFEHTEKREVFNSKIWNEGTSFDVYTMQPGNCQATKDRRDSDFQNVRQKLLGALAKAAKGDFEKVKAEFKADGGTIEGIREPE